MNLKSSWPRCHCCCGSGRTPGLCSGQWTVGTQTLSTWCCSPSSASCLCQTLQPPSAAGPGSRACSWSIVLKWWVPKNILCKDSWKSGRCRPEVMTSQGYKILFASMQVPLVCPMPQFEMAHGHRWQASCLTFLLSSFSKKKYYHDNSDAEIVQNFRIVSQCA